MHLHDVSFAHKKLAGVLSHDATYLELMQQELVQLGTEKPVLPALFIA